MRFRHTVISWFFAVIIMVGCQPAIVPTKAVSVPSIIQPTSALPRFTIRSIDVMKYSQDVVNNPPSDEFIAIEVDLIKQTGANYVAISPPISDRETCHRNQSLCDQTVDLTIRWVQAIRKVGLNVWFRQKTFGYEGWYDQPKNLDPSYHLESMLAYIQKQSSLFQNGDIFTPFPEPQNGGITGVNCSESCLFPDILSFNQWLRELQTQVESSFDSLNISLTVGLYGFDGYIAWGDRNPDRIKLESAAGFLEPETIAAMNHTVAIDHYFPADADPGSEFKKIREYFDPSVSLCVSEWGAIHGELPEQVARVFEAALQNGITCFNYWHLGPSEPRTEALLTEADKTLSPSDLYEVVKQFYSR